MKIQKPECPDIEESTVYSFYIPLKLIKEPSQDHPGVANSFLKNSCDALYILYGDSGTLEHHHFSTLCKILHNRENDIFTNVLDK